LIYNTQNQDKIDWYELSANSSAIDLLTKNQDKIKWTFLSKNPAAIDLLMNNKSKINKLSIFNNPNIFELDYSAIKKRMNIYSEELMMHALHPSRIQKMIDNGYEPDDL